MIEATPYVTVSAVIRLRRVHDAGIRVHDPLDPVFTMAWNGCSPSTGIRTLTTHDCAHVVGAR